MYVWIGFPVIGVGFTGALATSPPKRGDHRFGKFKTVCLNCRLSMMCVGHTTISEGLDFLALSAFAFRNSWVWFVFFFCCE